MLKGDSPKLCHPSSLTFVEITVLNFVIPTEAQRSGGICSFYSPSFAQICPGGICAFDELYLLGTRPAFNLFLSIKRIMNIAVMFKPDEAMTLIVCSEARNNTLPVLIRPARDAIGHATVQNAGSASNDIDVIVVISLFHRVLARFLGELQISPLRYASVGMTSLGRLPLRTAATWENRAL
jgi:hypothetical protein